MKFYVLATTETIMRWYRCETDKNGMVVGYKLFDRLDQKRVSYFANKTSAKYAAIEMGLKTWRYVKF
ncbi:MAG: hypothetical protein JEZ10_04595 [Verrucomicrobia bacterium]|nr:hypothetical protein [Verrucomicrobiota bacterium]